MDIVVTEEMIRQAILHTMVYLCMVGMIYWLCLLTKERWVEWRQAKRANEAYDLRLRLHVYQRHLLMDLMDTTGEDHTNTHTHSVDTYTGVSTGVNTAGSTSVTTGVTTPKSTRLEGLSYNGVSLATHFGTHYECNNCTCCEMHRIKSLMREKGATVHHDKYDLDMEDMFETKKDFDARKKKAYKEYRTHCSSKSKSRLQGRKGTRRQRELARSLKAYQ